MKKLSLRAEELRVESFDPQGGRAGSPGTVKGHLLDPTMGVTCICQTDDEATCRPPSCPITCAC